MPTTIDGQADYSGYTREQLIEVLATIDARRYPRDNEKLRQTLGMPPSAITTPADRLLPWQGPWYFPVSPTKLLVMYFATLGFYQIYWLYKQWAAVRDRERDDIWPVARAVFAVLFVYQLFDKIRNSMLSIFPLLPIQAMANRVNAKAAPEHDQNRAYSIWNKVGIALGFPLLALALAGTFGSGEVVEEKPEPAGRSSEKVVMNDAGR